MLSPSLTQDTQSPWQPSASPEQVITFPLPSPYGHNIPEFLSIPEPPQQNLLKQSILFYNYENYQRQLIWSLKIFPQLMFLYLETTCAPLLTSINTFGIFQADCQAFISHCMCQVSKTFCFFRIISSAPCHRSFTGHHPLAALCKSWTNVRISVLIPTPPPHTQSSLQTSLLSPAHHFTAGFNFHPNCSS